MVSFATTQIRFDHSHVLALFRSYSSDLDPRVKQALVRNITIALDIHTKLEEEIFYPALIEAGASTDIKGKSVPEHDEIRLLLMDLKTLEPSGESYDGTVMQLMRETLRHVADEESTLLPEAERLLGARLLTIGLRMTRRRLELLRGHGAELATNAVELAGAPLLVAGQTLRRSFLGR